MKRLAKPWIVMPLIAVVAIAAWWAFRRSATSTAQTPTQITATVTRGTMSRTVSASGTVAAAQTDNLSFSSGGTVTAVNVKAGDTVTQGQMLASIDPTQLQAAVSSAEATLASAQAQQSDHEASGASAAQVAADAASVSTAQDQLTQANANLAGANLVATFDGTVASVDLTVGEVLGSSGIGGTSQTGSASGSGATANNLGSSSSGGFGGGSSSGAQGSGGATQRSANTSATTSSSGAQIQVISSGRYTVTLDVSSADIGYVAVGQKATVALSSQTPANGFGSRFGRAFGGAEQSTGTSATAAPSTSSGESGIGTVTSVSQVADASSGTAVFPVVVTFEGSASTFQPGATVAATITYAQIANAVQVSTPAVTTTDSGSTVTVLEGTKPKKVTVTVGETYGGQTQIISGLNPGERVLIASFTPPRSQSNPSGSTNSNGERGSNQGFGGEGRGFPGGSGGFAGGGNR